MEVTAGGATTTFLTMELLEGETLAALIRRAERLTCDEAAPIVAQLAAGLGAAHDAGVVHRDFKPQNVLLVPKTDGGTRAVVTDFGIARAASSAPAGGGLTGMGEVLGTPAYMAPEQVEGRAITNAVDVYALGVTLY